MSARTGNPPRVISDVTNIIQINLNHCWAAQQLLIQTMAERSSSIALICDYHKPMGNYERWINSVDGKSAIYVTGNSCRLIMDHGAGSGFAWARINNNVLYSCYCSPNCTIAEFDSFLAGLESSIRLQSNSQASIIVAGDFNAHSASWGSATDHVRRSLLSDLATSLDLTICN